MSRAEKQKSLDFQGFSWLYLFYSPYLVAEVGFEPHDLRVMSPTSYQAALLRDIHFSSLDGAGNRDRTGTILSYHGILSPGRLPVPPHRQNCPPGNLRTSLFALCIIPHFYPFVNPFLKKLFSFLLFYNKVISSSRFCRKNDQN